MVRVASHIPRAATSDFAGDLAKCIPNRRTTTIFVYSSFNLICGGCEPPYEIWGQSGLLDGTHSEYVTQEIVVYRVFWNVGVDHTTFMYTQIFSETRKHTNTI